MAVSETKSGPIQTGPIDLQVVCTSFDAGNGLIGEVVIIDGVRTGFAALRVLHIRRLEVGSSLNMRG